MSNGWLLTFTLPSGPAGAAGARDPTSYAKHLLPSSLLLSYLNPPPILVLGFISVFRSMRVTSNGPKNKVQDPRPARAGETRL